MNRRSLGWCISVAALLAAACSLSNAQTPAAQARALAQSLQSQLERAARPQAADIESTMPNYYSDRPPEASLADRDWESEAQRRASNSAAADVTKAAAVSAAKATDAGGVRVQQSAQPEAVNNWLSGTYTGCEMVAGKPLTQQELLTCDDSRAVTGHTCSVAIETGESPNDAEGDSATGSCSQWSERPGCELISRTCIDDEPREVDGVTIERDCWVFRDSYACISDDVVSDCGDLSRACSLVSQTCLGSVAGTCTTNQRSYRCEFPAGQTPETLSCAGQQFCVLGQCYPSSLGANDGFVAANTYLSMLGAIQGDVNQQTFQVFAGERLRCKKKVLGFSNCCSDDGWGLSAGLDQCNEEALLLAQKRPAGMTHYVGTYCSKDTWTGACVEKTKVYCGFSSKLARIVQEQARIQISRSWGRAKRPSCEGFSPQELQRLDFAKMDLSEYTQDIIEATDLPEVAAIRERIKLRSRQASEAAR